jgi:arsenate reductase (glutaredoxin)
MKSFISEAKMSNVRLIMIDKFACKKHLNSMITIYGITNCTTVQKARNWLEANKKLGIDEKHLKLWCKKYGWDKVLNMQGQMWRKASDEDKAKVVDEKSAIEFMIRVPNSIKRPIVELDGGELLRGFDKGEWEEVLN